MADITLAHLRRHAVARSLVAPTSLPQAIARLGFVQADPIRAADIPVHLRRPRAVLLGPLVDEIGTDVPELFAGDTLVVAEEGRDEAGKPSMRHIGRVLVCKGYQAGNRETVSFVPGAGREAGCVAAAGDYAFTGGWKERGRVWVNRLSDGAEVGVFDPGPTVGGVGNTGWIDLLAGIGAFRRSTGEYLVFVEENYKAKSLIYRWQP